MFPRGSRLAGIALGAFLGATSMGAHAQAHVACREPAAVCEIATDGAMPLILDGAPASVFVDADDDPGVLRAARALQSDLGQVAGRVATLRTESDGEAKAGYAILAGTLGRNARIDRLVRAERLDVGAVRDRWEGYLLQVVDRPAPGIARALVIAGSDRRGTIFGIYEVSRRLGVSPWTFWADVPVPQRANLHVATGAYTDAPEVRWRGIFLNDEDPALGGWIKATYGGPNRRFYERVFDLILRLKGNYLWPAMWGRAFHDDDPRNATLAHEMGVVIGTTHHEPMMRAHVEWERYGRGPWDYTRNAEVLRAFWRDGMVRRGNTESLVTLGMRGDGDEPMTQDTAIDLLQRIVTDQRAIIAEVTGAPAARTPQVWALYKEVQDYFDAGMQVPDDVLLLFADDNWGNVRRLPAPGANRPGGYGVYYHFDYVGGPRNYKWLNTTQIERVWEQMTRARAHGADRLWIVNVGDLKPMEFPISFFLDQAWNPERMTPERLARYPADWAAQQFGPQHAQAIGELLTRYTQYNARRKPELLSPDTWSLVNYGEAERVLADWQTLEREVARIGAALPAAQRDAWVQLVQHPILASANLNAYYVALARNALYAAQGRASANAQADEAERRFARDAELQRVYEHDIADGKWIHMMSQPRIGYTGWQQPERNLMPTLVRREVPARAALGVAIEGDTRAWPGTDDAATLPPLDRFGARTRSLVAFNRGSAALSFTARASEPWLRVQPGAGGLEADTTLQVSVDWDAVPVGTHQARIDVRGDDGSAVTIAVPVFAPALDASIAGFVESDGVIAIEAEHYTRAVSVDGLEWKTIPNLGRTRSGVLAWPLHAAAGSPGGDGARLEYPIHLREEGELELRVVLSPSLDIAHRGGLRYAASIDDEPAQIVTMRLDPTPGHADFRAWERAVSDSVYVATSRHRVARAGTHTLKLWRVDPGLVFQRIELIRGNARASYLGAPQSMKR